MLLGQAVKGLGGALSSERGSPLPASEHSTARNGAQFDLIVWDLVTLRTAVAGTLDTVGNGYYDRLFEMEGVAPQLEEEMGSTPAVAGLS